jgi:C1A family cysteine protease
MLQEKMHKKDRTDPAVHGITAVRMLAAAAAAVVIAAMPGCGYVERELDISESAAEEEMSSGPDEKTQESASADPDSIREAGAIEELPSRYDAREHGRTSPVEDQGEIGACWAFASLSALESRLLPDEVLDFSEDHISHNPNFLLGQSDGGEYTMAMAYLLSWSGPVLEEQDPYGDGISPEGVSAAKHVQEIRVLPEYDRDAIKRAVLEWGGVESSVYMSMRDGSEQSEYYNPETAAYCYPQQAVPNHDIVIVGWDDDFPKEAFSAEVSENGAYLCENSWGSGFGEDGFFYVSYQDANLGQNNIVYSGVDDPDVYTAIWQSDLCGWVGQLGYGDERAWAANVYTADQDTEVAAAGFYATMRDTDYEVYLVEHVPENPGSLELMNRRKVAEGHLEDAGYYTIPFAEGYMAEAGERFAVEICLTTPGAVHPIAIEYDAGDGKCAVDLTDGEGYASADGRIWERVEDKHGCNVCLKAYGR